MNKEEKTHAPTVINRPHNMPVEVRMFGCNKETTDWSIKGLQTPNDLCDPKNPYFTTYLRIYNAAWDVKNQWSNGRPLLYAPIPSDFNAKIADKEEFYIKSRYPHGNDVLVRGVRADGCEVPRGTGFWLSTADCPTIITYSEDRTLLVCAHAGRDSLVDRKRLETGTRNRKNESVVDAIIKRFQRQQSDISKLQVLIIGGIGASRYRHPPDDPRFGEINKKLIAWGLEFDSLCVSPQSGCLNLNLIIAEQFSRHGVNTVKFDGTETYDAADEEGDPRWWSSVRGRTPEEKAKRNGIMIIHKLF